MRSIENTLLVAVVLLAIPTSTQAEFDTEIISYDGKLYVALDFGSWDKKTISVSESADGVSWARVKTLDPATANQAGSYGNPRFSIGPNGNLLLSCKSYPHSLTVWETADGRDWNLRQDLVVAKARPNIVSDYPLDSGLVWDSQDAYFLHCGSACGSGGLVYLFSRRDDVFKLHLHRRWMQPHNEEPEEGDYDDCDLLNIGSKLVCVTNSDRATRLGVANAPYQDWTWSRLVPDIKKPKLLQLPDDRILVTGDQGNTCSLFELNLPAKKLELLRTISTSLSKPSRVGMTLHKGDVWVGYRVMIDNAYHLRAKKMSLDNVRPTIPKGSLSELVEELLAQPELNEDNARLAAGQENSGRFASEVLRRRESIVEALTRIELDDIRSPVVRERLTALGPKTRELVAPVLCRQLTSQDAFRRQRARTALCYLTVIPESAVPLLLQAVQDSSQNIRESALQVLCYARSIPKSAEPTLRKRLQDADAKTRVYAAACLLTLNKDDESAKRVIAGFLNNSLLWKNRNPDPKVVSQEDIRELRTSPLETINTLLTGRTDTIWPLVMDRLDDSNSSRDLKLTILRDFQQYCTPYKSSIPRDRVCRFAVSPTAQHDQQLLETALKALGRLGNFDGENLQALSTRTPVVRRWLAEALASATVNRENAVSLLRRLCTVNITGITHDTYEISHEDHSTRDTAVQSLARLNVAHQRLVTRLTADFQSDDVAKKNGAMWQAELIAADAPELLPVLIRLLEDDSVQKGFGWYRYYPCEKVVEPLVAMGRPAVPALMEALESNDADARCFAAQALGRIGAKEAIEPLVNLLNDDNSGLSYAGKITKPEEIRVSALSALAKLGPETGRFVPQFLKFLDHESTREATIKVIANCGPAGTILIPKLKHLRADELEDSERREIALALACLSFDAPESMEGMRELLARIAANPQSNGDRLLARDALAFVQSQGERAALLIPELSYLVDQHEYLDLEYRAYVAAALAHIDAKNPRWRSLFEGWYADQFGRNPSQSPYWPMTQIAKALKILDR